MPRISTNRPSTTPITRRPPIVGVPALAWWLSGPSSRIRLPMPAKRRNRMYPGMRMTTTANARSRPWMMLTVIGARPASSRQLGLQGLDEEVELDAARGLDQHHITVAEAGPQEVEGG